MGRRTLHGAPARGATEQPCACGRGAVTGTTAPVHRPDADEAVRAALVEHRRHWHWGGGRRRGRCACTYAALSRRGRPAPGTGAARRAVGRDRRAVRLILRTPQAWANGIAVLCPDEQVALRDLHARLAARLVLAAWHNARTVGAARDAGASRRRRAARGDDPVSWTVEDFALVWSRPAGPPAHYEVLERYGAT